MAPRKLPPGKKQIHVGVSMAPETWATVQVLARGRHLSASAILREAVDEYLARRLGHSPSLAPEAVPA